MSEPNVFEPEWDVELDEPPFQGLRAMRLGVRAGAQELGATLYEIDPGATNAPYHVHHGNEELLLVLSGAVELRTPDGVRELGAGATVAFPRGDAGAHGLRNRSGERARVLIVSTMRYPEVAEHPDTGTTLAVLGPRDGRMFPAGSDIPFMEAATRAFQAAPPREEGTPRADAPPGRAPAGGAAG